MSSKFVESQIVKMVLDSRGLIRLRGMFQRVVVLVVRRFEAEAWGWSCRCSERWQAAQSRISAAHHVLFRGTKPALIRSRPPAQTRLLTLTRRPKHTTLLATPKQQGWETSKSQENTIWISFQRAPLRSDRLCGEDSVLLSEEMRFLRPRLNGV